MSRKPSLRELLLTDFTLRKSCKQLNELCRLVKSRVRGESVKSTTPGSGGFHADTVTDVCKAFSTWLDELPMSDACGSLLSENDNVFVVGHMVEAIEAAVSKLDSPGIPSSSLKDLLGSVASWSTSVKSIAIRTEPSPCTEVRHRVILATQTLPTLRRLHPESWNPTMAGEIIDNLWVGTRDKSVPQLWDTRALCFVVTDVTPQRYNEDVLSRFLSTTWQEVVSAEGDSLKKLSMRLQCGNGEELPSLLNCVKEELPGGLLPVGTVVRSPLSSGFRNYVVPLDGPTDRVSDIAQRLSVESPQVRTALGLAQDAEFAPPGSRLSLLRGPSFDPFLQWWPWFLYLHFHLRYASGPDEGPAKSAEAMDAKVVFDIWLNSGAFPVQRWPPSTSRFRTEFERLLKSHCRYFAEALPSQHGNKKDPGASDAFTEESLTQRLQLWSQRWSEMTLTMKEHMNHVASADTLTTKSSLPVLASLSGVDADDASLALAPEFVAEVLCKTEAVIHSLRTDNAPLRVADFNFSGRKNMGQGFIGCCRSRVNEYFLVHDEESVPEENLATLLKIVEVGNNWRKSRLMPPVAFAHGTRCSTSLDVALVQFPDNCLSTRAAAILTEVMSHLNPHGVVLVRVRDYTEAGLLATLPIAAARFTLEGETTTSNTLWAFGRVGQTNLGCGLVGPPPDVVCPPLQVVDYEAANGKKLCVVRDDLLYAGTKQRAAVIALQTLLRPETKTVMYCAPYNGFGPIATAFGAARLGLKCRLILSRRRVCDTSATSYDDVESSETVRRARTLGAKIDIAHTWDDLIERGRTVVRQDKTVLWLPLGLFSEAFVDILASQMKMASPPDFSPSRIFIAAGTGALALAAAAAFPTATTVFAVAAATDEKFVEKIVATVASNPRVTVIRHHSAPLGPAPYPTTPAYDERAWHAAVAEGRDGDVIWNVAGDMSPYATPNAMSLGNEEFSSAFNLGASTHTKRTRNTE